LEAGCRYFRREVKNITGNRDTHNKIRQKKKSGGSNGLLTTNFTHFYNDNFNDLDFLAE